MTAEQFARLTAAFWIHAKPEQASRTMAQYARALADISEDQLDAAIDKAVRELDRMPTPSKLRGWVFDALNASRRFAERPAVDGCAVCGGQPEPTVKDDGRENRLYLHHEPDCRVASFCAKPDHVWWRSEWVRERRPTHWPLEAADKTRLGELVHGYLKRFDAKHAPLHTSGD